MKYIVYCHTLNGKKYVGYTKKSIVERLNDHITETRLGSVRHFHRAIQKYGANNIISEELCIVNSREEAQTKEKMFIKQFDTFKNGYNMTHGGDGGNSLEKYTLEEIRTMRKSRAGMNNSNAKPDITKQMVVDAVVKYVFDNNKSGNYILRKEIDDTLKQELNVSPMIMKQRFTNGRTELLAEVNAKLCKTGADEVKYDPYYRSKEQRKQLSSATSSHRWATDGVKNVKLNAEDLKKFLKENKTYKQGRTL
jgi:hypothetical protein